ncbi:sensor histidine kinase [Nitriliruptor alkaliphilus]|uniref:sensor histidine kinase n=1 Tax=Nitriliruptor alkaliphilus TaxID=427918 RepID=UPI000697C755|nr:HAMP domain-containing sensor histidine kinase [Nitriliruptor alkaliphilus]
MDAADPGGWQVAPVDARTLHDRFVATAHTLPAHRGLDAALAHVVAGLLDLDTVGGDRVSLHLATGSDIEVVAILPATRPRTTSVTARRAVERGALVSGDDADGSVVAAPLVIDGRGRGALVVHRPAGRPPPDPAAVELAAVLLAGATPTSGWLDAQRELEVARADFVARVSHELRTPLTIISGFASTLGAQGEGLTEDERAAMLDRIVTAAVRLEHLVEELLTLASVELGHRAPEPVACVVRDVLDLVVRDQGGAGCTEVACSPDLRVVTDPTLARLVLGPVVENALHHGDHVAIRAVRVAGAVRITVHDDGPGIPRELGDRIFDRFVRGDDRRPGLGLGLATARQMGRFIGAELTLDDVPVGAQLRVDLPDVPT